MATLYEYYNTGADDAGGVYGSSWWELQSFTPATAHTITSVKICAYKTGANKVVNVEIYLSTAADKPTGSVLASGSANIDNWAGHTGYPPPAGNWVEISLGAGTPLSTVKYCIVVSIPTGDVNNRLGWYVDLTSPTYAGGMRSYSTDGGVNWTNVSSQDFMFEEWGTVAGEGGVMGRKIAHGFVHFNNPAII